MILATIEILELLKPRFWLIANVPGLDDSNNWKTVQRTIGRLTGSGYCIDYRKLNAADYGVPQRRIRPFWFGHRGGNCLSWPKPTHGNPKSIGHALFGDNRQPWVTCKDALQHLELEELGEPRRLKSISAKHKPNEPDDVSGTIRKSGGSSGSKTIALHPKHPPNEPHKPSGTIRGGGSGHSAPKVYLTLHDKHPINRVDEPSHVVNAKHHGCSGGQAMEWPWDRVSTTITQDSRLTPPGHHEGGSWMTTPNVIILSERAASILQGFPDGWVFCGKTKKARWSQIGQAMPPQLACAVGKKIKELI